MKRNILNKNFIKFQSFSSKWNASHVYIFFLLKERLCKWHWWKFNLMRWMWSKNQKEKISFIFWIHVKFSNLLIFFSCFSHSNILSFVNVFVKFFKQFARKKSICWKIWHKIKIILFLIYVHISCWILHLIGTASVKL